MIRITAKQDGFRRCGIAHPKEATEYPDDRFSKEELKQLQEEPMLVVEIGEEKKPQGKLKAEEAIAQIQAATTAEQVDAIVGSDTRATVIAAATARKEELAKPE